MGSVTNRNCCMGCGRFWVLSGTPKNCPYCADAYYCDNVIDEIPPPLGQHEIKCDGCGAEFVVETNDAKFCVMCKKEFTVEGGISQSEHQSIILDKMGL